MQLKGIKKWFFILATILVLGFLGLKLFLYWVEAHPPAIEDKSPLKWERQTINDSTFQVKNSFLQKNAFGMWEMYLEGSPFERGVAGGMLSKELLDYQEYAFASGIDEKVPQGLYQYFLKLFVAWFDKDLPNYVPEELQKEIYGYSIFAAEEYDYIGPKYHRKLNYHAAHDIGHALQNMGLVAGCTAVAAWDQNSSDSSLIIGRNFDFYVGDAFAKNKIILFMNPDEGIPFGMVTWPGFMGAVSGLNMKGISITLNAAPNKIPDAIKMPVALLAREILQYAATIEEAKAIAQKHPTFVSELFLIGSADENRVELIEKTPDTTLFFTQEDYLILSNHFQSPFLKETDANKQAKANTSTVHRYERMKSLFLKNKPLHLQNLANILRNTKGLEDKELGLGCEMAINQMTAHHSIIIKPAEMKFWVAGTPSQVGPFVAFDLDTVFSSKRKPGKIFALSDISLPSDSIIFTQAYKDYQRYKVLAAKVTSATKENTQVDQSVVDSLTTLNPDLHQAYAIAGEYFLKNNQLDKAKKLFEIGLQKALPWKRDSTRLANGLEEAMR